MAKVFEIAYASASEAYKQEPEKTISPTLEILRKTEGLVDVFNGIQVEEPNFIAVLGWETLEAHQRMMDAKESYAVFMSALSASLAPGSQVTMIHVSFTADPRPAFRAPVAELAWLTPKPGVAKAAVAAVLDKIVAYSNDASSPAVGGSYGSTHERPDIFVFTLGWPSVEAHLNAKKSAPLGPIVEELGQLITVEMKHGKLQEDKQ
ncbi:hypothetical protein BV25DRAFT_1921261 [Artomyces pyxidatus]|uniref:Uncharacterized protein n=1 Tax=Artomyces pyxidatus TaxID=48021 RepID=A0ACB8SIK3_9AGAM|nr:hypothetical protein BV25DRAFT_1921261 [Artomyces pyxidatus]